MFQNSTQNIECILYRDESVTHNFVAKNPIVPPWGLFKLASKSGIQYFEN
jgi:hypothetical protein